MKFLINIVNYFLFPLVRLYWRIFRPKAIGVKVFVKCKNKVLLIQNSYGRRSWTLPGGGIKRNESLEDAAKREVKEEVGIDLIEVIMKGSFLNDKEGKQDTIVVFFSEVDNENFKIDNFEIQKADWMPIEILPSLPSPIVKKCLDFI